MRGGIRRAGRFCGAASGPPSWVLKSGGVLATLDVDFVNNLAWNSGASSIAALLSCTRATPAAAYYTKADGSLTTFAANASRYGTNGLLVEEARTNKLLQSQTFDNIAWIQGQASISANATTAPDGTVTADTIIEDSSSNAHYLYNFNQIAGTASNTTWTLSLYAKPAGRTKIEMYILDGAPGASNFSLGKFTMSGAGSVISATNGGTGSGATASIDALANGWYRVKITGQPASADSGRVDIIVALLDNSGNESYAGNGTSGAYLWGAQLEAGAFATSYIPTTSASVTRAADVVTQSPIGSWYNASVSTLYTESKTLDTGVGVYPAIALLTTLGGDYLSQYYNDNDSILVETWSGAAHILLEASASYATNTLYKIASVYKSGDSAAVVNGGAAVTSATAFDPITPVLYLGSDTPDNFTALNGYIRRLAYWPSRLANGALQTLTT